MITKQRCRSLLLRYANSRRRTTKKLTGEEMEELMEALKTECREVHNLLVYIQASSTPEDHQYAKASATIQFETVPFTCPAVWVPFVEALGTATPVCGLIHQDEVLLAALEILVKGNGTVSSEILGILKTKFPVLHDIVITFESFKCPAALLSVIKLLVSKSKKPFEGKNAVSDADSLLVDNNENEDDHELSYSHWPGLEQGRRRGQYAIDKESKKSPMNCHKSSKGHPTLLPGVFTMFCEHGKLCTTFLLIIIREINVSLVHCMY